MSAAVLLAGVLGAMKRFTGRLHRMLPTLRALSGIYSGKGIPDQEPYALTGTGNHENVGCAFDTTYSSSPQIQGKTK